MSDHIDHAVENMLSVLETYHDDGNTFRFDDTLISLRATLAGDAVYITKIWTESEDRGDGSATDALNTLCGIADGAGATLCLGVEPFDTGGLTEDQLLEWYWRFGFRGDSTEMIRAPLVADD